MYEAESKNAIGILGDLVKEKEAKDIEILHLKDNASKVEHSHKQQQEELRTSYDHLLAQHTSLQTESEFKIKELQAECNTAKKKTVALKESNNSLEQSLRSKEELIQKMGGGLENATTSGD